MSERPGLQEKAYYNAGNTLFMAGNHAQDLEQQLSNYYDARYQYHQALNRNPGDEQAKKNLSLSEERIKEAEKQKENNNDSGNPRRQRKPQNRRISSSRARRVKSRINNQNPAPGDPPSDDQQAPGAQRGNPSDPEEGDG